MVTKILIPLDGSDLSAQALPVARRLVERLGSCAVELLYVFNSGSLADDLSPSVVDEQLQWASDYLASQAAALSGPDVDVRPCTLIGPPALLIPERISQGGFDYVVMATHGRSGLARAVIGSVTDIVLRQSPVPVLVVSPRIGATVARDLTEESTARLIEMFTRRDTLANDALAIVVDRGAKAVPELLSKLRADKPAMRQMAVRALGQICQTDTATRLVDMLSDDDFEVRWEAAKALSRFGDRGIEATLTAIIHRPLDRRIAQSYEHVLSGSGAKFHDVVRPVMQALQSAEFTLEAPIAAQRALQAMMSMSKP